MSNLCICTFVFLSTVSSSAFNPATVQAAKHLDSTVRSGDNPGDVMWRAANRGQINEKVNE